MQTERPRSTTNIDPTIRIFALIFSLVADVDRDDGMTVFFSKGKCLIWDHTCVNSSPHSLCYQLNQDLQLAQLIYTRATILKGCLIDYIHQSIAAELSSVIGPDADVFIADLYHLTTSISCESREGKLLRKHSSSSLVSGNAQAVTQADHRRS